MDTVTQTSSVAGALPRMSSELRASRSTALLSGIASSLPVGMLRCAWRHATRQRPGAKLSGHFGKVIINRGIVEVSEGVIRCVTVFACKEVVLVGPPLGAGGWSRTPVNSSGTRLYEVNHNAPVYSTTPLTEKVV